MNFSGPNIARLFAALTHPAGVLVSAVVYFVLVRYFDTRWRFMPYTFAATLTMAALIFAVTRRYVFSLYTAGTLVVLAALVSMTKHRLKGLALHAYDFVFTGLDSSVIEFLVANFTSIAIVTVAVLSGAMLFLARLYRADRPLAVPLALRFPAVFALAGAAYAAHPAHDPDEASFLPYIGGYNASALPLSVWNLPDLVTGLPLSHRLAHLPNGQPLADTVDCGPARARPDLFMILSESQTSPLVLPEITTPPEIVDSFRSGDGTIKPLFVETVGGGTWMTNFSVLTGLSTADFGWQAAYVTQLLQDRVKGSLPEVLARCGYRTVSIMPMEFMAMHEGPFLKSIGFQEVHDADRLGIKPMTARDSDYFSYAEALVAEHRANDGRPLFLHIQTMYSHAPYDSVLLPAPSDPKHVFAQAADINEYMRRVAVARADLRAFLESRRAAPGPRGSVVAEFGDHQSSATRDAMLARHPGRPILTDLRSPIYETFFAVQAYGTGLDYGLLRQAEDAPFLAARLLAAAGLPSSPLFDDLLSLSAQCSGRFHTCEDRLAVDRNLKRRVDAGMLVVH